MHMTHYNWDLLSVLNVQKLDHSKGPEHHPELDESRQRAKPPAEPWEGLQNSHTGSPSSTFACRLHFCNESVRHGIMFTVVKVWGTEGQRESVSGDYTKSGNTTVSNKSDDGHDIYRLCTFLSFDAQTADVHPVRRPYSVLTHQLLTPMERQQRRPSNVIDLKQPYGGSRFL